MGLQTEFLSFSLSFSSFSSSTPLTFVFILGTENAMGWWGGYCTVDHGSCAEDALLIFSPS